MLLQAAGAEPSGLNLVLPDSAELLWLVLGLGLLLAIAAGVLALIIKGARSSQRSIARDAHLNELAQRVRALEEQAQRQHVE